YDRPFQWGSRRIGPDLAREGGLRDHLWHYRHFKNPKDVNDKSIMPRYPWLLSQSINFKEIQGRVDSMALLGVPYGELLLDNNAVAHAENQALEIAVELESLGGPSYAETQDKKVIALIAYLQRLGTDIKKSEPEETAMGGDQQ
ncbi:MAG: cbb3-type cytochrome c oxidase subunit II, partial [bacterium]|nr:cbb3-type cytochrome c oxidase subunit II [bacterium]